MKPQIILTALVALAPLPALAQEAPADQTVPDQTATEAPSTKEVVKQMGGQLLQSLFNHLIDGKKAVAKPAPADAVATDPAVTDPAQNASSPQTDTVAADPNAAEQ